MIRTVQATRYVAPLREGGSLPAIVEADDDGLYVVKFRGAGQGPRALIAELIVGEVGRVLGLPVPEIVFVELDPVLGRNEPDSEIKALLDASAGLNIGLDFLPGSIGYDPADRRPGAQPDARLASAIVWFDAYITNVDRSARNTNMLLWHKRLYLIDHGAALYFHHAWVDHLRGAQAPFPLIGEHVLLPLASAIRETDAELASCLTAAEIERVIDLVPDSWLGDVPLFEEVATHRRAYVDYLVRRLESPRAFVQEAINARAGRV